MRIATFALLICLATTSVDAEGAGARLAPLRAPVFPGIVLGQTDFVFADGFESCTGATAQSCYGGPPGTAGVGTCTAGVQQCVGGVLGPCTGETTPHAESCDGRDDDCDGATDEDAGTVSCGVGACRTTIAACTAGSPATCTPGAPQVESCDGIDNDCDGAIDEDGCNCVHVSAFGLDTNPGTAVNPLKTIGAGIALAATSGPPVVCVAGSPTCSSITNYDEAVAMRDGVHVYGGYQPTGATWPRNAACTTRIRAQNALGVVFDSTVTVPTILDGFSITGGADPTNAAVTIDGSTGAVLSDNVITGGGGTTSYGVNVVNAATPRITGNIIVGGTGATLAVGVHALASAPTIENQCTALDAAGRCTSYGCAGTLGRSVRGRAAGGSGASSIGIHLESSPGAIVDRSAVCSGTATGEAIGVRIAGDAEGVIVRNSNVAGTGQQTVAAIRIDGCAGASPWIFDNALIAGTSSGTGARTDGIRAMGDCHPRIDHNVSIVGGSEGAVADATAVRCERDAGGIASRCSIIDNTSIRGSTAGFPPTAVGVRCDDGACATIRDNALITGRGGQLAVGVMLGRTGTLVAANVIEGGCATVEGVGLLANDAFARIENNQITGVTQGANCTAATSSAARLALAAGTNEVDLHSNDLFGGGFNGACSSRGLVLETPGAPPAGPRGQIRNNIVLAGACSTAYAVLEASAAADPRIFRNNDLWGTGIPTVLYRDENAVNLLTATDVNALTDTSASGNISADPLYASGHLLAASMCRNAGTASGAPGFDFEGDTRPKEGLYDIGRDEYVP